MIAEETFRVWGIDEGFLERGRSAEEAYTDPRLQILTIEQLLAGASVQMPPETGTFMAAQKVRKQEGKQGEFELS